jgi:glutamate-5-semialdehyde dehydrogenase
MSTSLTPRVQAAAYTRVHEANARARRAATTLRALDRSAKDKVLTALADALLHRAQEVFRANATDLAALPVEPAGLARLSITRPRLRELAYGLLTVAAAPDPIGEVLRESRQRSGMQLQQIRVPIGVVAVLVENQPEALVRAAALMLKSGNALLLHDHREGVAHTEATLVRIIREVLETHGVPADAVQLLPGDGRASIRHLLNSGGELDLIISLCARGVPRQWVAESSVPVAAIGPGNCHVYVDAAADLALAARIVLESKIPHAELSHAAEKLLVHTDVAALFVPALYTALRDRHVEVCGDERVIALVPDCPAAGEGDWRAEYQSLKLACAVVDSCADAISHINRYGSAHTEAVVTTDPAVARMFAARVDAATIVVNTPTTFGQTSANPLDPELAYSTRRLHPRGPLKLTEFTTTKWLAWPADQGFSPLAAPAAGPSGPSIPNPRPRHQATAPRQP